MSVRRLRFDFDHVRGQLFAVLLHPGFIGVTVLCGLFVRLVIATMLPLEPASDGAWYVQRATELTHGLGYQEGGFPTAYWPVGYPAILAMSMALVGTGAASYIVLNLLAAAAVMALIVWFGRAVVSNEMVARLAVFGYAIYPNHIAYSGQPVSEVVYTALYMGAFALLIKCRHLSFGLIGAGLLFGISTLVKAQTILFPFGAVVALWLVFGDFRLKDTLKALLVVYVATLLVVLPWSVRNLSVFDKWVLVSTNGGVALLIGANDYATGDHMEPRQTPLIGQIGIPWEQRVERQVAWDARHRELAVSWIKENPAKYLALMPKKVMLFWMRDTDGFWAFGRNYPWSGQIVVVGQWLNQAFYVLVLLLALPCALIAGKAVLNRDESISRLALLFCMPVFGTLLAMIFTGQIRYHFPAMPMLFLAAAWVVTNAKCFTRIFALSRA